MGSLYIALISEGIFYPEPGTPKLDFFSMDGIVNLFKHSGEKVLLGAWIHYIIFDLWTGQWITNDYVNNIEYTPLTKLFHVTCLGFTLMFGPSGLCLYLFGKYTFLPPKISSDEEEHVVTLLKQD